ncbi:hypothetical protein [Streptosporangium carneum]|uniref:DUF1109 domain-containing protein n=1 Tax=Streptosporangium carneum TaxID=47481 RepID=A0A9W6I574_9ACTN|nr:hypothetical protein [Streptosporangium carneum]GLK11179.1 hypothetical protein GCM10017600_45850 [Streptosporangium carneum]
MLGNAPEWPLDSPMTRSASSGPSTLARVLTGPPGRLLIPSAAFAGLLLTYGDSVPGSYFMTQIVGALLALGVAVVWGPRFVVGLLRADGRPGLRRHWARWAAVPLVGATVFGLLWFDVPSSARFALSKASMEQIAQRIAAGKEPASERRWAGLYQVSSIERSDDGVIFYLEDAGFLDRYGFIWSPKARVYQDLETAYKHIEGPWYEWREWF